MKDVLLNQNMDIVIEDGDVVMDTTPETAIRLALSTSNNWWGQEGGGGAYDLLYRGKLSHDLVLKTKQRVIRDLEFLNEMVDGYSVEVYQDGSQIIIDISIIDKNRSYKWIFPQ